MKYIPILFSTLMVQAILEGRKTMTRRIMKPQPDFEPVGWVSTHTYENNSKYQPGDVLWVRETWRKYYYVDEDGYAQWDNEIFDYAADNPEMINESDGDGFHAFNKDGTEKFIPFRPSIHMPKKLCRIFLEITDVRVERLQDITEADAVAEGMPKTRPTSSKGMYHLAPVGLFQELWNGLNGPESWELDQWVWVIGFKPVEKPNGFTSK